MPRRKPNDPRRCCDQPHDIVRRTIDWVLEKAFFNAVNLTEWDYKRARFVAPGTYDIIDKEWSTIHLGQSWGGDDVTAFFRKTVVLPEGYEGQDVLLDISLDGGEAQLSVNGHLWQGLDWYRSLVPLRNPAHRGDQFVLEIEAFIINYPYDAWRADERADHIFRRARLVCRDRLMEEFYYDAIFAHDVYVSYWKSDDNIELEELILNGLQRAIKEIDIYETRRETIRQQVVLAREILKELVYDNPAFRHSGQLSICAQSHLDIVYMWPIKETFRKNCRTCTNALSLMREYPDFKFSYSQPFLYEKLQEMYPQVFADIKEMVKAGRWEVIGGMYVEPDANLPGGESMVRQILFGKRYIRREFGVDTQTCWMPDVFGAGYTLPQILIKCGLKYFTTIKLNTWNDENEFPHHTFWWQGLDGSRVLTHFPPTHFGEMLEPDILRRHWRDYAQKTQIGESLFQYGWSDGGGGPTREMVEASLRVRNFPGMPAAQIEPAEDYFNRIEKKADGLPVWSDELYLEAHRGTYTTRGDLKKANRQAELLYRDAEIVSSVTCALGAERQQDRLNEGWKKILLNQFHDTLPGTHVPACIADTDKDYEEIFSIGRNVLEQSLEFLASGMRLNAGRHEVCLFNTLSWDRNDVVGIPCDESKIAVRTQNGTVLSSQFYDGKVWCFMRDIPALGWTTVSLDAVADKAGEATAKFDGRKLVSPLFEIEFADDGSLRQIVDRRNNRDILEGGCGNELQVFEDCPGLKFSAWDIAQDFEARQWRPTPCGPWEMVENGPVFAILRCRWKVLNSTIEQDMIVYRDLRRIDFRTRVDWQDSLKLLKVAFPLAVKAETATYDLPFGHIDRPTHRNTTWDQAKFEVCGHKWADMSEGNYGVSLLNDCKYGYDACDNRLRLSLVRSPVRPNATSDIGSHEFTYSLFPHTGSWREGGTDRAGYELNIPTIVVFAQNKAQATCEPLPKSFSFLRVSSDSVIVEAIKQAEDSDEIVIRAFDSRGCRGQVTYSFAVPLLHVNATNMLEEEESPVSSAGNEFVCACRPYEIQTYKVALGDL